MLDQFCISYCNQHLFPRQVKYDCFLYGMEIFFWNTNIKSIVKHYLLLKWNKSAAVAGDEHAYLKRKKFVDTPSEFYLIILRFIWSYVWNFLKIKIHTRSPKVWEKRIFYLIMLIAGHSWITECSFPWVTYLRHG